MNIREYYDSPQPGGTHAKPMRTPDHRNVELGNMECPPCTDYSEMIKKNLLSDWGLSHE